jgi:hypothetical protein
MAQPKSNPGKNFVIPVSNGILEHKHRAAIGSAIWVFLWLIDRCTKEQEDDQGGWLGLVLGGKPLTGRYISEQSGEAVRSVRRHLKQLEDGGYIVIMSSTGEASSYAIRSGLFCEPISPKPRAWCDPEMDGR